MTERWCPMCGAALDWDGDDESGMWYCSECDWLDEDEDDE